MSTLPAIDCVVRLSTPVNTKAGPATCSSLKKALRVELLRLFAAAQRPVRPGKSGGTPSGSVPPVAAGNVPSSAVAAVSATVPSADVAATLPRAGDSNAGVPA